MPAFSDVFHLFTHKLASLSAGRFAFALVFARAFNDFFFWHNKMISPLATLLDVTNKGLTWCRIHRGKTSLATEPLRTREQAVMRGSATSRTLPPYSVALKNFDAYSNDHLAGSVAGLELVEHWQERHKGDVLESFFGRLETESCVDRDTLREVMDSLGVDESTIRQTGAWAAEKMARARLTVVDDEPGFVLALEGLIMGISGKRMLWRSLAVAKVANASKWDFKQLQRRAEDQIEQAEAERIKAAQRAFACASDQG